MDGQRGLLGMVSNILIHLEITGFVQASLDSWQSEGRGWQVSTRARTGWTRKLCRISISYVS
jgi:hypothetical protein